jgi:hypothetical protein
MRELALLLTEGNPSRQDRCLAKILQFFGVPSRSLTATEFRAASVEGQASSNKPRIFCSAEVFTRLIQDLERGGDGIQAGPTRFHSAFVYAGNDSEALQKLARILADDDRAVIDKLSPQTRELVVSDHLKEFCGVLAGLRVSVSPASIAASLVVHTSKGNAIDLISADHGAVFQKVSYHQAPVFLSTCHEIIDIDVELGPRVFDVRDHFLTAVPVILYIKWAFAQTCWAPPETNACLVIDDPPLKPTYGCVDFEELLALMERHRFSTNIAFIPWNWRRSNPKVVRLFTEKPECYSLSIHGCDHTAAEFGSQDREYLRGKVREAIARMHSHERQTGIRHDRIMVFPQGVFSEAAMDVLKHSNFAAAVNSEVMSTDPHSQPIRISDVWDIAVMRYGDFPVFTRRDPSEGIENFAFDILLGKPCIVVIHHDFCRNRYKYLLDFINALNALNCPLSWRSLGEVVRRGYRQRGISAGVVEVEMYGAELRLENRSEQAKRFLIRRRECEPSAIREVHDGSGRLTWNSMNGHIDFEIELDPGESRKINITFHALNGEKLWEEPLSSRAKAMVRRYLSEVRDNYVATLKR